MKVTFSQLLLDVTVTWGSVMMVFLALVDLFFTVGSPFGWLLAAGLLGGALFTTLALFYIYLPTLEQQHTLPPDPPELIGAGL